jgi:5-(carboxyamino)imidazole ribonucleotide mutase
MPAVPPPAATPLVGIIMGSLSDWPTMKKAADVLDKLGVPYEAKVVSAHRTPERLYEYAKTAWGRGLKVIIAGAGGAAHLPGMTASMTTLPVLGVPVQSKALSGQDSLLSIVQMPAGVPVGTLAIGDAGATNAGLLAASILALSDPDLALRLAEQRAAQAASVPHQPPEAS